MSDNEEYSEPKAKNELDLLPPSTFKLDNFKRFYSNNEESASIKHFWETFDPAGFTLLRADYIDNPVDGPGYRVSNLVNGFFRQWQDIRKYAFGSFCVFETGEKYALHGLLVMRGSGVSSVLTETDGASSFAFTVLDPASKADRAEVNAYLAWTRGEYKDGDHTEYATWSHDLVFDSGKLFK